MHLAERVLAVVLLASSVPALAQSNPVATEPDDAVLTEVLVTARKVEEKLQDVPLSIRAFSGAALEKAGVTNLSDLAAITPGLSYATDLGRTAERPVVRGVSALRPEAAQPVSVFLDGVYVRDGVLSLLLEDVQRVEVVKGPQSALYGRATYMGAINVVGIQPTDELTGRVVVTAAEDQRYEAFGVISGPLLPGRLSGRLSAKHYEFGGQYTNRLTGRKIGDEKTDQIQGTLRFNAADSFEARVDASYKVDRDGFLVGTPRTVPTIATAAGVSTITSLNGTTNIANGASCNGRTIQIVGNNPMTGLPDPAVAAAAVTVLNGWPCGASDAPSSRTLARAEGDLVNYTDPRTGRNYGNIIGLDRKQMRTSLTLDWDLPSGQRLTSQTAYTYRTQILGTEPSLNGTRFATNGTAWLGLADDKLRTLSQELRISSARDQSLTWQAGVFGYAEDFWGLASDVLNPMLLATAPVTIASTRLVSPVAIDNYAAFVQAGYAFNDRLQVSGELRYNVEKTRFGDQTPLGTAVVTTDRFTAGQPVVIDVPLEDKKFAPRLTADFKLTPDAMLYAQIADGFKSGGINVSANTPASQVNYDGEEVRAYEVGFKSAWLGNRLRANVALFWNDIQGLQLSNLVTGTNPLNGAATTVTIVNNVGEARTRGVELELDAALSKSLRAGFTYALTDAKALRGTEVTNGTVFGGNQRVDGAELPRSPRNSAAAFLQFTQPLARWQGIVLESRLDVTYESRRYAEIQNLIWADPRTVVNLSAGVSSDRWKATLWVKNLTNSDEAVNAFRFVDPVTFRRSAVDYLPRLRQVGATLTFTFD